MKHITDFPQSHEKGTITLTLDGDQGILERPEITQPGSASQNVDRNLGSQFPAEWPLLSTVQDPEMLTPGQVHIGYRQSHQQEP